MSTLVTLLLLQLIVLDNKVAWSLEGQTCHPLDPPMNLGTGSLDHLVDALLQRFLTGESAIHSHQIVELSNGILVDSLTVYNLNSIRRTCPLKLTTSDSKGCQLRHGLFLDVCLMFDRILVNMSIMTWIPGLRSGHYQIEIQHVSVNSTVELFSSPPSRTPNAAGDQSERKHRLARILHLKLNPWHRLSLRSTSNGAGPKLICWFLSQLASVARKPIVTRVEWTLKRLLNNELRMFQIQPLFAMGTIAHEYPIVQYPGTKSKTMIKTRAKEPTSIMAIPVG